MKKQLLLFLSLAIAGAHYPIIAEPSAITSQDQTQVDQTWQEFLPHVLHFGYISHNFINADGKQLTDKHRALREQLRSTYQQSIKNIEAARKTGDLALQKKAIEEFTQYLLTLCDQFNIGSFYQQLPKAIDTTVSSKQQSTVAKRAVSSLENTLHTALLKPLPKRIADTLFYNLITTQLIPDTISNIVGPTVTLVWSAYTVKHYLQEINIRREEKLHQPEEPDSTESYPKTHDSYDSDSDDYFNRSNKRSKIATPNFIKRIKDVAHYSKPTDLLMAKALLPLPIAYATGKFLKKIQYQEYSKRQEIKRKEAPVMQEMKKVTLVHEKQTNFSQFDGTVISQIKPHIAFLHNPASWWLTQNPGTHGLLLQGTSENILATLSRAIAHETKTPIISMSFLHASTKEKVQAVFNRAYDYAIAHNNKSIIICIENIDYINKDSKAMNNIMNILFNTQNNPYVNMLVIGTAQDLTKVPAELKKQGYFDTECHLN